MQYEQAASFGELLKAFRKQKRIGQQQVAEQLAVHRNTIGAWERGDRLPDTRGMVLELARCLQLDEQETTCLLEASLTGVSTRWNVPYRRNPFFTGREELMQRLHTLLRQEKAAVLTQSLVLSGLGGIGKTQMAVEYAYRYAQQYASVFWINADTMESILASYTALAALLDLPEQHDLDQQKAVTAVNRWLCTHREWLLIVDNVEDHEQIVSMLPTSPEGCLLFTTRRQTLGTLAYPLEMERMSQEEGVRFLLYRSRRLSLDEPLDHCSYAEVMEAGEIVRAMEGLPLALDQAGAYIEETQCSLQDYLQLFQSHRAILLGQRGGVGSDHPASVATTLSLSIATIARQDPAAVELLQACALLHPDGIPEEVFLEGANHLGPVLAAACADMFSWNRLVATVSAYSLLRRQPKEKTLSMHRLVQAVLQDGLEKEKRGMWLERLITALDGIFPKVEFIEDMQLGQNAQAVRLLPHVLSCAAQEYPGQQAYQDLGSILFKAAAHFAARAQYMEAESLYLRARYIWEQALGPEHPQVAYALCGLAKLYERQGKYVEVEPLFLQAKHIWEQTLGPEHPQMAYLYASLGHRYQDEGRYAEAEALFQRALYVQERVLGSEHPIMGSPLNGLGILCYRQGKYAEAEQLYQRARHIWEQALGPEHPNVAILLNNLAELYSKQGKYAEAEQLYQQAQHIWERSLGFEHPMLVHPLHGLAVICKEQGKYAEAEALFERALALQERYLDAQHIDTAEIVHSFATLRWAQRKMDEAATLFLRAIAIREHAFGADHLLTREIRDNYAIFLRETRLQEVTNALELRRSEEIDTP